MKWDPLAAPPGVAGMAAGCHRPDMQNHDAISFVFSNPEQCCATPRPRLRGPVRSEDSQGYSHARVGGENPGVGKRRSHADWTRAICASEKSGSGRGTGVILATQFELAPATILARRLTISLPPPRPRSGRVFDKHGGVRPCRTKKIKLADPARRPAKKARSVHHNAGDSRPKLDFRCGTPGVA